MNRLAFGFSFATAVCLLGTACSLGNSDDGSTSSDEELRVKPVDSENWARLTLLLPTGSCQPGNSCSRPLGSNPSITIDGSAVSLGAATRLKPGEHVLTTNGGSTKITLNPGQSRSYVLPVARSKCTATALPVVPPTDFGKTVTLSNAQCPTVVKGSASTAIAGLSLNTVDPYYTAGCGAVLTKFGAGTPCTSYGSYTVYGLRVSGGACVAIPAINAQTACNAATSGDWSWASAAQFNGSLLATDQVFIPDTYSVSVGGVAQSFTLAEGNLSDVPVSLPVVGTVPSVFTAAVTFADARELPNGGGVTSSITSSCGGDRAYTFAGAASGTVNVRAFADSNCVYTLNVAGRTTTLSQTSPNAITINRVDVDDVVVTREDGSTYAARGTYELFYGGNRVVGALSTNTGIDVLPGTYELVITYSTVDGQKTQRQTITL